MCTDLARITPCLVNHSQQQESNGKVGILRKEFASEHR